MLKGDEMRDTGRQEATRTATGRAVRRSPMEHPRHQYPQETAALQAIARECGLAETVKWGKPCFTVAGKNVALVQRFNEYAALLFFKGALLNDPGRVLCRVGQHMQAPRQMRFRSVSEVESARATIEDFLEQAAALERSGAKVPLKKAADVPVPEELQQRLDAEPALREAFAGLTPGRQKAYLYRIAAAKQAATRAARVALFVPRIMAGKGLND